jgi:putative NADPH-quinone reductase
MYNLNSNFRVKLQSYSILIIYYNLKSIAFIDRLFLPGFAFQYRENSVWWDKLLKGKTAHIITTLDQPSWYYWFAYGRPSINQLKKSTLEFCGVKPVKLIYFGAIKTADIALRKKWLDKVEELGRKQK